MHSINSSASRLFKPCTGPVERCGRQPGGRRKAEGPCSPSPPAAHPRECRSCRGGKPSVGGHSPARAAPRMQGTGVPLGCFCGSHRLFALTKVSKQKGGPGAAAGSGRCRGWARCRARRRWPGARRSLCYPAPGGFVTPGFAPPVSDAPRQGGAGKEQMKERLRPTGTGRALSCPWPAH